MASITKLPSGLWRAQVARRGVRRSASFQTKRAAQEWAAAQEAEIMAGVRGEYPRKTVADALDRYAREVSPTKRTGAKEVLRLAAFGREPWAQKWLVDLTPDDLGQWRDRRALALKPESIRRDLTTLSAVFSTAAKEWRWMRGNPVSEMRWPAPGKARTRLPTWREIRRICRACGYVTGQPPQTKTGEIPYLLLLSLRTAMRKGEMLSLTAGDIDLGARVAVLHETKNGDRRDVPLSRRAVRILRPIYPQMWSISSASLDTLWRKLMLRLGIADLHLHDARAAALTSMSRRVDLLTLARISGHRDLSQLQVYYRSTAAQIADRL
jgi:integrase